MTKQKVCSIALKHLAEGPRGRNDLARLTQADIGGVESGGKMWYTLTLNQIRSSFKWGVTQGMMAPVWVDDQFGYTATTRKEAFEDADA